MKKNPKQANIAKNSKELSALLGLSKADTELMKYKAQISSIAVQAINNSGMPVSEIVKKSGVARSKVSAVKNGATVSVSIDLMLKIIVATGTKITFGIAS
jgi:predicted XRE-type DNA-binding protein